MQRLLLAIGCAIPLTLAACPDIVVPTTSTTTTIPEVQQGQAQTVCAATTVVPGASVSLLDIVVASAVYEVDPTQQGFYAHDPAAPVDWAGIHVVAPLGVLDGLTPGAVVTVIGDVEEFYCMTQINASSVTINGSANPADPIALTVPEEAYEGMLVTVDNVTVGSKLSNGAYDIGDGLQVANDFNAPVALYLGEPYTITGFLKYADNAWQIVPRDATDASYEGSLSPETVAAIQQSAASVNCTTAANTLVTAGIVVEGTISVGRFDLAELLHGYHLTSGDAAFESISISVPKTMNSNYLEGQRVRVIGDHVEFFCNTQIAAKSFDVLATEAVPAPVSPALEDFAAAIESWEGALVTLSGLVVADSPDFLEFGEISTTTTVEGTVLRIDDAIVGPGVLTLPPSGTSVTVTGVVRFGFGSYKITPRSTSDVSW